MDYDEVVRQRKTAAAGPEQLKNSLRKPLLP